MSHRYVFKFFASIGPGGAFSSLTEQVCTSIFPQAYKIGDDEDIESPIDKNLKVLRQEYIGELFQIKNKFERAINSGDEDKKEKAYKDLLDLVKRNIEKVVRMEKNKYMRERVYYQRNNEIAMYEAANKAYLNCRKDVEDNLIKQAKTVCKPNPQDFAKYFGDYFVDAKVEFGEDDIKERISEYDARRFYEMWIKIKTMFAAEKERLSQLRAKGGASPEDLAKMAKILDVSPEEVEEIQKDLLFVESGEDVEDLFIAFSVYNLTDN